MRRFNAALKRLEVGAYNPLEVKTPTRCRLNNRQTGTMFTGATSGNFSGYRIGFHPKAWP